MGFTLYDEDEYTYDEGYSHVWLDEDRFKEVVADLTGDVIEEILIEQAGTRYREGYIVELYPMEAEFAGKRWTQVNDPDPMTYVYRNGKWTKFFD